MFKTIYSAFALTLLTSAAAHAEGSFIYWSMWNEGEPQQKVLASAIEGFTAETGIAVDVQWVGRDIHAKVGPTLNSPKTPFTLLDGPQRKIFSALTSTGNAASLDAVYAAQVPGEDKSVEASLLPELRGVVTHEGQSWMVPYILFSSSWWYDAARFPELPGNEPKTWDDMIALFQKHKDAGDQVIALDGDIGIYNLYYFCEIAVRYLGAGNLNAAIEDKTGEALKNPAILKTAQQIQQLVDAGFFASGYDSSKWPAQQQQWAAGNIDFNYNGTWLPKEVGDFLPEGAKPASFQMPLVGEGAQGSNEVGYIGFSISAKGPDIENAQKFIAYAMKHDIMQQLATDAEVIVPRPDIEILPVLQPLYSALKSGAGTHAAYDDVNTYHADYTTKVLNPLVNELVFGQIDAQTFQDKLVDQTVLYWDLHG